MHGGATLTALVLLVCACDRSHPSKPPQEQAQSKITPMNPSNKAAHDRALRIMEENADFEIGPPGSRQKRSGNDY